MRLALATAVGLFATGLARGEEPRPFHRENLYAWGALSSDAVKSTPAERATMLQKLGFIKVAYDCRPGDLGRLDAECIELKKRRIDLLAVRLLSQDEKDIAAVLDVLNKNGIKAQLWVEAPEPPPALNQAEKVKETAAFVTKVAEAAGAVGCKLAIFNHAGWGSDPANLVAVIRAVKMPNVGIACNWLRWAQDYAQADRDLLTMMPHLLAVNLAETDRDGQVVETESMVVGSAPKDDRVLKSIRNMGYRGPIGIPGLARDDAADRMQDNLAGLRWLHPKIDNLDAGPKPMFRTQLSAQLSRDEKALEISGVPSTDGLTITGGRPRAAVPGTFKKAGGLIRFEAKVPLKRMPYLSVRFGVAEVAPYVNTPNRSGAVQLAGYSPAGTTLPVNALRQHVFFTAPMTRGSLSKSVRLVNRAGGSVSTPFLERIPDLWSPDGRRLTLIFDPERMRPGSQAQRRLGPILEPGKQYSIIFSQTWLSEFGQPPGEEVKRDIDVGPRDDRPIDPAKWRIRSLRGINNDPYVSIKFDKVPDAIQLHTMLWLVAPDGTRVDARVSAPFNLNVEDNCQIVPIERIKPGEYKLVIDARLEDVCGNRIGKAFNPKDFMAPDKGGEPATIERPIAIR